jgi:hypothetical protein
MKGRKQIEGTKDAQPKLLHAHLHRKKSLSDNYRDKE